MKKHSKLRSTLLLAIVFFIVFNLYPGITTAYAADHKRPSVPGNLTASSITQNSVVLTWSKSTDNIAVASYSIYMNSTYLTSTTNTNYTVTGLIPGTAYSFYIKAKDTSGNYSYASNTVSIKTLGSDTTAPSAPTGLSASSVTASSLDLSWQPSTDNVGVTSYLVYKDGTNISSISGTNYSVTGLTASSTYSFYIKAIDAAGNISAASTILTVKTVSLPDTIPPSVPSGLTASLITTSSLTLSWAASTDNTGVTSYMIYKNSALLASTAGLSYTVTGLASGTQYSFYVVAKDAAGNASLPSNTVSAATLTPSPSKIIYGYYASWAAYSGYTPANIPASQVTHVSYAFANISTDLKIEMGDPQIDPSNFTKLNDLKKQNPNIKTLIAVGGWDWSGKFSDVAYTDASRSAFADSVVAFIKQYGFNGVDIDWEYPCGGGLSTNISRPEDKTNFTLLLAKLREKLDAQGASDNTHYLLTIAGGSGSLYASNVELNLLANYVDYATVMTYDIHGTWDKYTDFNAPLYNPAETSPQYKWSVNTGVNLWLSKGFPASKLIMGVPFYGYKYTAAVNANNGLYQTFSGGGSISYNQIESAYLSDPSFIRRYHTDAKVPWLFNGSTFISYDDVQSVSEKAAYINSYGLAGAAVWELSQNSDGTLLNALYSNLK